MQRPIQICRGFSDADWKKLRQKLDDGDEPLWSVAIDVFRRRIEERFLAAIDALIAADSRQDVELSSQATSGLPALPAHPEHHVVVPGFAIMALCCLLAETMQSFYETPSQPAKPDGPCCYPDGNCIRPSPGTGDQFRKFLKRPAFNHEFDDEKLATKFATGIRNAIFHNAETRKWLIWRDEPPGQIVERRGSSNVINRTEFYRALRRDFEDYIGDLKNPANEGLRKRFVVRMNKIAKEC